MSASFLPQKRDEFGYLSLLTDGQTTLTRGAQDIGRTRRQLLMASGLTGTIARWVMKYEDQQQERLMLQAKETGERVVVQLQELSDLLTQQGNRHRLYLEQVVGGFLRSQEYEGLSAEETEQIAMCERGLEKILRGTDAEIREGLEQVLPQLPQVEALIRKEGWYRRALRDYRNYAQEGVLHYGVHLFVAGKLRLLSDVVARAVQHQSYVIDNTLDMMKMRQGLVATAGQLARVSSALEKSKGVFVDAVLSLRELEQQTANPGALLARNNRQIGTGRYVPYGPEGP